MQPTELCDICSGVAATPENLKQLVGKQGILLCRGTRPLVGDKCCALRDIAWGSIDDYNEERRAEGNLSDILADANPQIHLRAWNGGRDEGKAWYDIDELSLDYLKGPDPSSGRYAPVRFFELYASPEDPASKWISTREPELDVRSATAFQCIHQWITNCAEKHHDCPKPRPRSLPTRVIDVGPGDGSQDPKVYITNGKVGNYLTLSYCWGGPQPVILTSETVDEKIQSLPLATLPRTIQDAVTVTRGLRTRYLWVDALCIIQDSPEDKEKELGRMAQIYRDGLLTISAASAAGCQEGFLQLRKLPYTKVPSIILPYGSPEDDSGGGNIILRELKRYDAFDEPANRRAWVLQERLLSPRVVVYGTHQLRWQCQTKQLSNGGVSRNFFDSGSERLDPAFFSEEEVSISLLNLTYTWVDTVIDYTRRSLTFGDDKLVAISAIASEFQLMRLGDHYLAGLWRNSLIMELMWMVEPSGNSGMIHPRPEKYRAPSWSWASVDGPVAFGGSWNGWPKKQSEFAKILSCHVTLASEEVLTGAVVDGVLEIKGQLKKAKCESSSDDLFDVDVRCTVVGKAYMDAYEEISGDVWCLRLQNTYGMILKNLSGNSQEWRRVGFCEIRTGRDWQETTWFDGCESRVAIIK